MKMTGKAFYVLIGIAAIVGVAVIIGIGVYTVDTVSKWQRQNAFDNAHLAYMAKVEPKAVHFAMRVANPRLQDYNRGAFQARLDALDREAKEGFKLDFDVTDNDYYSSLLNDITLKLGFWVDRQIHAQGIRDKTSEEWKNAREKILEQNPEITHLFELRKVLNDLGWNHAGLTFHEAFDTEYTWQDFEEDETQFVVLKKQCDELMEKIE